MQTGSGSSGVEMPVPLGRLGRGSSRDCYNFRNLRTRIKDIFLCIIM